MSEFQHTAARRRLVGMTFENNGVTAFQHTAARRRLVNLTACLFQQGLVSTHSRPKAAGWRIIRPAPLGRGFNTQPPEGGWSRM